MENKVITVLFENQVRENPNNIALVSNRERITYVNLNEKVNQIAHYLISIGIKKEVVVALHLEKSTHAIIILLAILKAGGAYLPVNCSMPKQRIQNIIEESGAELFITDSRKTNVMEFSSIPTIYSNELFSMLNDQAKNNPDNRSTANDLAYIMYTSGSTGKPKGVEIEHAGISNVILAHVDTFRMSSRSRALLFAELHFDASISEMFTALTTGACLYLIEKKQKMSLEKLHAFLLKNKITTASIPPVVLSRRLKADNLSLETLIVAGDVCSKSVMDYWKQKCRVICGYGPTESTVGPTLRLYDGNHHRSIGHAICHMQCILLDKNLNRVAPGKTGEIYIGGIGLARGYRNQPELTSQKFIQWFDTGKNKTIRLYKTGDAGRLLFNNEIEFIGRLNYQVKFQGIRVDLSEIDTLLSQHKAIQQSVVLLHDIKDKQYLTAYIIVKNNKQLSIESIRLHLEQLLPPEKIPNAFVFLDKFPVLSSGKIDRQALPTPIFTAKRTDKHSNIDKKYHWLAKIWAEVLGCDENCIHEDSHFFSLGGTSLDAINLSQKIEAIRQIKLDSMLLFEMPIFKYYALQITSLVVDKVSLPVISKKNIISAPMSFAQRRLWIAYQTLKDEAPESYNVSLVIEFSGNLNAHLLETALNHLLKRHEILRTCFPGPDKQQIIDFSITLKKKSLVGKIKTPSFLKKVINSELRYNFGDLTTTPLIHAVLYKIKEDEFIFILVFHHAIIDFNSLNIIISELSVIYNALYNNAMMSLKPLAIQYIDYSCWERECLVDANYRRSFDYWREQLKGAEVTLNFPTSKKRPIKQSFQGGSHLFYFPTSVTKGLKSLAKAQGTTLFSLLLATLAVLFYRLTNQEDFIIGVVYGGERSHPLLSQLVGFFANILPIRIKQHHDLTFPDVLQQTHRVLFDAYKSNVPIEEIINLADLPYHPGYHPLCQVSVNMIYTDKLDSDFSGVDASLWDGKIIHDNNETAKFDLDYNIEYLSDSRLAIKIIFASDLFEKNVICNMASYWNILCEGIIKTPHAHISQLPLLNFDEKQTLLRQWSLFEKCVSEQLTILDLFEQQALNHPNATAVIDEGIYFTYKDVNDQSNKLARYIKKNNVLLDNENVIALALEGSADFIISIIAILKTGSAYLPIDPNMPIRRVQFMLEDSEAILLLSRKRWKNKLFILNCSILFIDEIETQKKIKLQSANKLSTSFPSHRLAYIIYTSGSTGNPKGVMIQHNSVAQLARNDSYIQITHSDVFAQACNVSFDVSGFEIWGALLNGASIVIYPNAVLLDIDAFKKIMAEYNITVLSLTTVLFHRFLLLDISIFNTIKWLIFCGEKLTNTEILCELYRYPYAPPKHVLNVYGPTEATIFATACELTSKNVINKDIPIGFPIKGTITYILDSNLQPVPEGVLGELYLGGVGLARGYFKRPTLNSEKFIKNPFLKDGSRLYRTGDIVRYNRENGIIFVKRIDRQIKLSGHRIELMEIEATLLSLVIVKEAVVTLKATKDYKILVAYVVPTEPQQPNSNLESQLRLGLERSLPKYMVPTQFHILDSMPLNSNGKLDRQKLIQLELERSHTHLSPNTSTEKALTCLWKEVLNSDHEISVMDNFFKIGGTSLSAIQLTNLVSNQLGSISYSNLMRKPTIREQAQMIENSSMQKKKNDLTIDFFESEAFLPPDIRLSYKTPFANATEPKAIFLTGVTGFFGIFLLKELLRSTHAKIYCLVRANNLSHAQRRFNETLIKYNLQILKRNNRRIQLIIGDVGIQNFGLKQSDYNVLSESIDWIYHSASEVNFLKPYTALKNTNVIGTRNVLYFSIHLKVKPVYYISSASVFSFAHYFHKKHDLLKEEPLIWDNDFIQALSKDLGYMQSKIIAERMVCEATERQLPITVYRLGFILCDSETGAGNIEQMWGRLIMDCSHLGYYPQLHEVKGKFITVNFAAQAVTAISQTQGPIGKIFHIVPDAENNITTDTLFSYVTTIDGYPLKSEPFSCWRERLQSFIQNGNKSALQLLLPLFTDHLIDNKGLFEVYQYSPEYCIKNTLAALQNKTALEHSIDRCTLRKYQTFLLGK